MQQNENAQRAWLMLAFVGVMSILKGGEAIFGVVGALVIAALLGLGVALVFMLLTLLVELVRRGISGIWSYPRHWWNCSKVTALSAGGMAFLFCFVVWAFLVFGGYLTIVDVKDHRFRGVEVEVISLWAMLGGIPVGLYLGLRGFYDYSFYSRCEWSFR